MPDVGQPVDQERCDDATDVTHGGADEDTKIPEMQETDLTFQLSQCSRYLPPHRTETKTSPIIQMSVK